MNYGQQFLNIVSRHGEKLAGSTRWTLMQESLGIYLILVFVCPIEHYSAVITSFTGVLAIGVGFYFKGRNDEHRGQNETTPKA